LTDSATWTERYAAAAMVWDTTPNQFVVAACRKLAPGRALDLGAGEGRNSIWLAGRGWSVTAVDFASIAVGRIASRAALQNVRVDALVADVLTYHPKPSSYELILLSYLQLPIAQLRKLFVNVLAGLAPGGRILLIGHDATNLDAGCGGPQNPDLLTTPDVVATALAALGLKVARAEVVQREVQSDVGIRFAYDHVVEAVRHGGDVAV
jgi:SAM-dependent methyltransferase